MFYRLPPVGKKISAQGEITEEMCDIFMPFSAYYFNSGAASLAVAIKTVGEMAGKETPEVIVPAYTCPEVISAVLFSGAKPVLVDMELNRPWMDLNDVRNKITHKTVAIIAVNFLGIKERISLLYQAIGLNQIKVIEDSAQALSVRPGGEECRSDLMVYSFGRGKPVSVLGGGAIICKDKELNDILQHSYSTYVMQNSNKQVNWIKIKLYNLLIHPRIYWLPEHLPFLNVGHTVFKPLEEIKRMSEISLKLVSENIKRYQESANEIQRDLGRLVGRYRSVGVVDLPKETCLSEKGKLLRYPILLSTQKLRDALFDELDRAGLGVSRLYPSTLPKIVGLRDRLAGQGGFPNADYFSKRILTLPTHDGVNENVLSALENIFNKVLIGRGPHEY